MRFHLSVQSRKLKRYVAHIAFSVSHPALTTFGVLILSATGKEGAKEVTARIPGRNASAQLGSVPRRSADHIIAPSHTPAATTPSDGFPHADIADGAATDARWRARGVER